MATVTGTTDAPVGTSIFAARTKKGTGRDPGELGKDDFMKLLLTQLQHQDPMKPMDDQAFIAQVAQFNTLDQMTKLNTAVTAMLEGQKLAEASGMIGKVVTALDADGEKVTGTVTAVGIDKGVATLHLGAKKVTMDKVSQVAADAASLPTPVPAEA